MKKCASLVLIVSIAALAAVATPNCSLTSVSFSPPRNGTVPIGGDCSYTFGVSGEYTITMLQPGNNGARIYARLIETSTGTATDYKKIAEHMHEEGEECMSSPCAFPFNTRVRFQICDISTASNPGLRLEVWVVDVASGQEFWRSSSEDDAWYNVTGSCGCSDSTPILSKSTDSLDFDCDAERLSFDVWNDGGGTLTYQFIKSKPWIRVDPPSGSSSGDTQSIAVGVDREGIRPGTYSGIVTIDPSSGANQTIQVTMCISDDGRDGSEEGPTRRVSSETKLVITRMEAVSSSGVSYPLDREHPLYADDQEVRIWVSLPPGIPASHSLVLLPTGLELDSAQLIDFDPQESQTRDVLHVLGREQLPFTGLSAYEIDTCSVREYGVSRPDLSSTEGVVRLDGYEYAFASRNRPSWNASGVNVMDLVLEKVGRGSEGLTELTGEDHADLCDLAIRASFVAGGRSGFWAAQLLDSEGSYLGEPVTGSAVPGESSSAVFPIRSELLPGTGYYAVRVAIFAQLPSIRNLWQSSAASIERYFFFVSDSSECTSDSESPSDVDTSGEDGPTSEGEGGPQGGSSLDKWDPGDDSIEESTRVVSSGSAATCTEPHTIGGEDRADWYVVGLEAGEPISILVSLASAGAGVRLTTAQYQPVAYVHGQGEHVLSYTAQAASDYYIFVYDTGSDHEVYSLCGVREQASTPREHEEAECGDQWDERDNTDEGANELVLMRSPQRHGPHTLGQEGVLFSCDYEDWFSFFLPEGQEAHLVLESSDVGRVGLAFRPEREDRYIPSRHGSQTCDLPNSSGCEVVVGGLADSRILVTASIESGSWNPVTYSLRYWSEPVESGGSDDSGSGTIYTRDGSDPDDDEASGATPIVPSPSIYTKRVTGHSLGADDEVDWYRVYLPAPPDGSRDGETYRTYVFRVPTASDSYTMTMWNDIPGARLAGPSQWYGGYETLAVRVSRLVGNCYLQVEARGGGTRLYEIEYYEEK